MTSFGYSIQATYTVYSKRRLGAGYARNKVAASGKRNSYDKFKSSMDIVEEDVQQTQSIPEDVLEDLCSRFLINIPEEEKNDSVRICFQIECAHWFYLDFYRQEDPSLPACGMQQFLNIILSKFPFLNKSNSNFQDVYQNWKKYKFEVPVYGAILLDESLGNCILVRSFHKRISWGFPKGKVNKDEDSVACAIREVQEETGFDITEYIDPNEYIERNLHDHMVQLYIVPAVPMATNFQPKTRGEIEEVKWFNINCLPVHKKDTTPREKLGLGSNSFFLVQPFVKELRKWVAKKKQNIEKIIVLAKSLNTENVASSNSDNTYRVLAPNISDEKEVISLEQEKKLRQRKEEEQRKYQEIYSLTHPLRENHSDNERRLKDLLGLEETVSKSKKKLKNANAGKLERRTENQPEAIRKLLTGTVDSSPLNEAQRRIGQGFGSPNDLLRERETYNSFDEMAMKQPGLNQSMNKNVQMRNPLSTLKQPMEHAFIDREVENVFRHNTDAPECFQRKSPVIKRKRNDAETYGTKHDANQDGVQTESLSFTKTSAFLRVHKSSTDSLSSYPVSDKKKLSQSMQENCFEQPFAASPFVNFRFDREALIATLPPAQ